MQIVIDIPDILMEYIVKGRDLSEEQNDEMAYAITDGIPLPKGHGRILDEKDILDTENNSGGWYDLVDMLEYIAGVKPIIEVDTERSDEE